MIRGSGSYEYSSLCISWQHTNIQLYILLHQHSITCRNLQIEKVVDQDQGLSHGVGYEELVTRSHINCKVTPSVMCRAKYKSDPGWVLARNLNLRDTLVPNVCRVCT